MENFVITDIQRDVKDGKYILKSNGIINGNVQAQTVIVYGNVIGNIKADEVVLINGKCTGNIHADTVVGLERSQKREKNCQNCKYYDPIWLCPKPSYRHRTDFKFCDNYKEKERENPTKQVSSPRLPVRKSYY